MDVHWPAPVLCKRITVPPDLSYRPFVGTAYMGSCEPKPKAGEEMPGKWREVERLLVRLMAKL